MSARRASVAFASPPRGGWAPKSYPITLCSMKGKDAEVPITTRLHGTMATGATKRIQAFIKIKTQAPGLKSWSMLRASGHEAKQGSQDPCSPTPMLSSLSPSSDPKSKIGARSRRTMVSPYKRSSSIVASKHARRGFEGKELGTSFTRNLLASGVRKVAPSKKQEPQTN